MSGGKDGQAALGGLVRPRGAGAHAVGAGAPAMGAGEGLPCGVYS